MLLRNWRGWHRRASRRKQRLHTRQRRRNRERNALLQPHLGGIEHGAGAVRMHVANRIRQLQVRKLGRAASCENPTRAELVQQRSRVSVVLRSKTRLVLPCRRGHANNREVRQGPAARLGAKAFDSKMHSVTEAIVVHVVAANNRHQEPSSAWHLREQSREQSAAVSWIAQRSATQANSHKDKTGLRPDLRKELRQILCLLAEFAPQNKITNQRQTHRPRGHRRHNRSGETP